MEAKAIQDFYQDRDAVCYGCGRLNEYGHQIKSFWQGGEAVCQFQPRPYHTAIAGYTYGGLLASLADCHATSSASAAMYQQENRPMGSLPAFRFVTGELKVRYNAPTPIDSLLELRARVVEIKGRKVTVQVNIFAGQVQTVEARVIVFQVPEEMQNGSG